MFNIKLLSIFVIFVLLFLRFHINLYNPDSLIACVLPYHETKVFVRVIQLLKIQERTNRWNWLQRLQVYQFTYKHFVSVHKVIQHFMHEI